MRRRKICSYSARYLLSVIQSLAKQEVGTLIPTLLLGLTLCPLSSLSSCWLQFWWLMKRLSLSPVLEKWIGRHWRLLRLIGVLVLDFELVGVMRKLILSSRGWGLVCAGECGAFGLTYSFFFFFFSFVLHTDWSFAFVLWVLNFGSMRFCTIF